MIPDRALASMQQLLARSMDGVLAFDRECRFVIWNPAMEKLSGMPAADVLGQNAFELFPFLVETGEDRVFHRVLAGETVVSEGRPFSIAATRRSGFLMPITSLCRTARSSGAWPSSAT